MLLHGPYYNFIQVDLVANYWIQEFTYFSAKIQASLEQLVTVTPCYLLKFHKKIKPAYLYFDFMLLANELNKFPTPRTVNHKEAGQIQ